MADDSEQTEVSRRDAMKTALKVGAYAAPVILSVAVPSTALAQVSGGTGTLSGTISSAGTGLPIAGATVTVGGRSATTNASGVYTVTLVPSGPQVVATSAANFSSRTDTVTIAATGTTAFSTALVLVSAGGSITIVLGWGQLPTDLDSHLIGPNIGSGRFEVAYYARTPVAYASLDVDDVTSFGPETVTISPVAGNFVPGSYSYFVDNYSRTPGFDVSGARVTVFQSGAQIAQFLQSTATGSPAATTWSVFTLVLTATPTGQPVITPVQQFTNTLPTGLAAVRIPKT
jgi:hypothetical protein